MKKRGKSFLSFNDGKLPKEMKELKYIMIIWNHILNLEIISSWENKNRKNNINSWVNNNLKNFEYQYV